MLCSQVLYYIGGKTMVVNKDKCISCGACMGTCPANAISFVDDKAFIDQEKCAQCGMCKDACPVEAIEE